MLWLKVNASVFVLSCIVLNISHSILVFNTHFQKVLIQYKGSKFQCATRRGVGGFLLLGATIMAFCAKVNRPLYEEAKAEIQLAFKTKGITVSKVQRQGGTSNTGNCARR